MRIPEFEQTIAKILQLHISKNEDYALESDPFSNFRFTEHVLGMFPNNRDKSFVWPISTKLARLSVLLNSNSRPNFESIEDSFDDIATYVILWKCDIVRIIKQELEQDEKRIVGQNYKYDMAYQAAVNPVPAPDRTDQHLRETIFNHVTKLNHQQLKAALSFIASVDLGRLNYAGPSDEGKPAGRDDVSPTQRRTEDFNGGATGGSYRPRGKDPR